MDVAIMIALVTAGVQALKAKLPFIPPVVLAVLVSLIIVSVKAFEAAVPFNLALFWIFIQVLLGSVGSFKILNGIADKRLSVSNGN